MSWLLALVFVLAGQRGLGFDCEFPDRECGWSWTDAWTLLTPDNTTALGPTAPHTNSENNAKGQFFKLFVSVSYYRVLVVTVFDNALTDTFWSVNL